MIGGSRDVPGLPGPVRKPERNSWGAVRLGSRAFGPGNPAGVADLTLRELVTVRRYHAGQTPAEIAAALGEPRTRINPRIDQTRRKLGLDSRAALRVWLAEHADELEER